MGTMKTAALIVILSVMCPSHHCGDIQRGDLADKIITRPVYRSFMDSLFKFLGRPGEEPEAFRWNLERGKLQPQIPVTVPWMCNVHGPGARSAETPTSVHRLRPGDIDIVASLGDSLTAGNGAMARNVLQVASQNKGVVTFIGGQYTWHKFLTIPNILKEYNPKLYGYSVGDGLSIFKTARFNVGEATAMSRDIPHQAKILIRRMRSDPNVDIENHWKLITIMIGPNDFCSDICYVKSPEKTIDYHDIDLTAALRTIRDNLPKTMVNVIPAPSMRVLTDMKNVPDECVTTHYFECPCMFGSRFHHERERFFKLMENWQLREIEVANREEFHNKPDFTVNIQPFTLNARIPTKPDGSTDFTFTSLDCFHLSQKGYSIATNSLWNNMFEPKPRKTTGFSNYTFAPIRCPTDAMPYLRTNENS